MKRGKFFLIIFFSMFCSCQKDTGIQSANAYIESVNINGISVANGGNIFGAPVDSVVIHVNFSTIINTDKIDKVKIFISNGIGTDFNIISDKKSKELVFRINKTLNYFTSYKLYFSAGENLGINLIDTYEFSFVTQFDSKPKFPVISNDSLLTLVQKKTFGYFWNFAHPVSGLARERLSSGETVTSGGSGFGIMCIPVAIERGFMSRAEGVARMNKIVDFLSRTETDKFHGAFPHWLNGSTGKVFAFSAKDNGADLVETAYLIQGLLTVQSYFKNGNAAEQTLCQNIQKLWENVDWNWFQQNNQQKLYWHWSPNYNWDMNMPITGWNECLIVYVLAASSPTHSIAKSVYDEGWARNGAMKNGKTFYNITLPLGEDRGGPLFFSHYSFLGLDPRNLSDNYANYWQQNISHAQINYRYCLANPKQFYGYSKDCWGLTASDIPDGYTASSPNNDLGVIAPTAALSSFPYTPEESMRALHFYYYTLGDKLWGEYGFKDAFSLSKNWFASSYLAIDQGPIVVMIENYRSGLLWRLFMQNPDVQTGLNRLGFSYN